MNQYIVPLPHNDPRLFSHVSHAFSLVDLGKRLLDAAKNGDVDEVKSLMNSGAPFTTDWLGISPLHFAAMNGHLSSCEALLCAGISRDARTKVDRTPLHLAAQEGHADIVELLLRSGAEIGAKDMLQMTALHWAAERGHTPVVQMLMRFGADARVQNKFEMTPLDIADSKGHFDARDAMLNTRDDMASFAGRMAATGGNLVDTNAYILTEEETLVPAAPPAGEVIVTATTVDEAISDEQINSAEQSNGDQDLPVIGDSVSPKVVWDQEPRAPVFECVTASDVGSPSQLLGGHCANVHLPATDESVTARSRVNATCVVSDEFLHQWDDADFGRDIMLVETPSGEMLHVRQIGDDYCPESLAIFTSTGERLHSPHLMAQVIEALADLPKNDDTERVHSESVVASPDNTAATTCAPAKKSGLSVALRSDRNNDLNENNRTDVDDPTTPHGKRFAVEDSTLLVRLASFVEAAESEDESMCVDDVGPGASAEDFCNWCLCHGIVVKSFDSDSNFVVRFVHDHQAYTLNASYNKASGATQFRIP